MFCIMLLHPLDDKAFLFKFGALLSIEQIVQSNLSAVFLGDSTWTELFPRRFLREYAHPSFNIFDLDSVDNAINAKLPNELLKTDWSLLVAHYLGVDHCGHKHGPLHPEMGRKLTEMNEAIRKIIDTMDNETTLFVIGDHGMTATGKNFSNSHTKVHRKMLLKLHLM